MENNQKYSPVGEQVKGTNTELNPSFNFQNIGITSDDIKADVGKYLHDTDTISNNLKIVLDTSAILKESKAKPVNFSEPILKQVDNAVIFPHTINVIQGQAGVHKSRLAEYICSAFLKTDSCSNQLLGFKRYSDIAMHTVVYVDTERNLSEQLPYALQSIQTRAGYRIDEHPNNFNYISLLQIDRKGRFATLNEYLTLIRKTISTPLFIVLDVSTDCIEDFNKTDKSMELIDLMNKAINAHDVVFLCLIHENPKSDKARGHFGTELMNKASTVMQVGFEKDAYQNDTNIIRVKYLKCRSTARHTPFYFRYCDQTKELVLANANEITTLINSRKHKANLDDVKDTIEMLLADGSEMKRKDFIEKIKSEIDASVRTIEARLKEIGDQGVEMYNENAERCLLKKVTTNKITYYKLVPNKSE
jgi:phage baseplate assembly protein W